ncbi:MAG: DUF2156 domain-containing protein [Deltaproteobacteria bacterium]|nr:DUF2156 domain-containing protein [Deltaproteobacteria bacterium]
MDDHEQLFSSPVGSLEKGNPAAIPARLEGARRLILRYGWNATAYQILNPGIERWFSESEDAVIGYVSYHGHRVVAGSPVCALERLPAVIEEFETQARQKRQRICYFAADERLAEVLARRGPWDRLLLGAQPVWNPEGWPGILRTKASLRGQLNRARNKGLKISRLSHREAQERRDLRPCLKEWLATRGLPPLHFLVEPETLDRLWDRRVFVAELDDQPVGFLVLTPVPCRRGYLVEQNIRGTGAPNGTTESLLHGAMEYAAHQGANYLTLGLCPLSQRAALDRPSQRWWLELALGWLRAHGRRFYNFDGLDAYKAKFLPQAWEPIYAITSDRRVGLGTLWAIAGVFGKMSPARLAARALGRALLQEARWLRKGPRS